MAERGTKMAYQITLSDEDYTKLQTMASESGKPIEILVHEAISHRYAPTKTLGTYSVPTGEPDTPEDEAELEHIAHAVGNTRPWPSEMVIEDRGPR